MKESFSRATSCCLLFLVSVSVSALLLSPCHAESSSSSMNAVNAVNAMNAVTHKVKSIVVVGGTHGNEYCGVWVSKALDRKLKNEGQPYKSFHLSTIIGNPEAHLLNKRFVDQDLNRRFSHTALTQETEDADKQNHVEVQRAEQLNQILGPKFEQEEDEDDADDADDSPASCTAPKPIAIAKTAKTDLIIDLHTTTTNMHTTLIVAKGDPLTTKAAAYVILKCKDNPNPSSNISILMHTHSTQHERPHVSSIAPHCFSIEAGPVPTGLLRHDIVENMQVALEAALEFVERFNTEPDVVDQELRDAFPSGIIPCFVSAPSKRKGEISSKIAWPSDPDNPNFPAWIIHKSIQDKDFSEIRTGDPLFVDLDGNTIPYDGSHGSPITLLFVNEGGYYYASSGTGISVAQKRKFRFETAELLPLQTEKDDDASS